MSDTPKAPTAEPKHPTREQWLEAARAPLGAIFAKAGHPLPDYRVSCGWPSTRATSKKTRIGECWHTSSAEDKMCQVFISPLLADPVEVLDVLCHEAAHVATDATPGHGAPFKRCGLAVGLEGKPTTMRAGAALKEALAGIAEDLGPYPHSKLTPNSAKKQSTRLLKVSCPECGYVCRVTKKWLEDAGPPLCPCFPDEPLTMEWTA